MGSEQKVLYSKIPQGDDEYGTHRLNLNLRIRPPQDVPVLGRASISPSQNVRPLTSTNLHLSRGMAITLPSK